EDFVHLVTAIHHDDRLHGDAGRLHVDQQEGNALLRLGLGIGANQAEDPVGPMAHRVPGLGAVDDVVVALLLGLRAERGEIGARTRLGVALAPPHGALANRRQVLLLLLVRAERVDHRPDHLAAEWDDARRVFLRTHVLEDVALRRREAGTAVLLGPGVNEPALLPERLLPAHVVVAAQMLAVLHLVADVGRQIGLHEGAYLVGEFLLFGRESEIHRSLTSVLIWSEFRRRLRAYNRIAARSAASRNSFT